MILLMTSPAALCLLQQRFRESYARFIGAGGVVVKEKFGCALGLVSVGKHVRDSCNFCSWCTALTMSFCASFFIFYYFFFSLENKCSIGIAKVTF